MAQEIWGTFAVNDHCRPDAFVADVLIYDRVVLPVPADDAERQRWLQPNPHDPAETWDPDRLQAIIEILGTQRQAGRDGARLAWEVDWDQSKWTYERSRLEAARIVSHDAFWETRRIVATDEVVPAVVDAVVAYPSASVCVEDRGLREIAPSAEPIAAVGAVIARPLLLPEPAHDGSLKPLREAVDLAMDDDFQAARRAYYDWVRDFFAPLQGRDPARPIDAASLALASEKLAGLLDRERSAVRKHRRTRRWRRATAALTIIGLAAGGAGALSAGAPTEVIQASAGILGWVTGKLPLPPPDRPPLTGASMFATSQQHLDWLKL